MPHEAVRLATLLRWWSDSLRVTAYAIFCAVFFRVGQFMLEHVLPKNHSLRIPWLTAAARARETSLFELKRNPADWIVFGATSITALAIIDLVTPLGLL